MRDFYLDIELVEYDILHIIASETEELCVRSSELMYTKIILKDLNISWYQFQGLPKLL